MDTNIPVSDRRPRPADGRAPGPKGLGVLRAFLEFKRKGVEFLEQGARQYGPVAGLHFFGFKVYLVTRHDLIDHILVRHRDNYLKSAGTARAKLFFGHSMQTKNGEPARQQRQLMGGLFRPERIRLFGETMAEKAQAMAEGWRDGETRNISQDVLALTLDIAIALHFGELDGPTAARIRESFLAAIGLLDDFLALPVWVPTPGSRRFLQAMAALDAEVYALIAACREGGGEARRDLLAGLVSLKDGAGQGLSDKQIRDELVSMMAAGYFPTAVAVIQTLRLLAAHPDVDARMAQELATVLGGKRPAADDLGRLPYTGMVVKESLRLCPPAGGMVRIVDQEDWLDGWRIPAKSMVFISQWVMHHSPEYFDEPGAFRPERWTSELSSSLPNFVYFPFGWGSRACIGQVWGLTEVQLILATVLQRFKLVPPGGGQGGGVTIDSIQERGGLRLTPQARP
jgi:cytochrome P450